LQNCRAPGDYSRGIATRVAVSSRHSDWGRFRQHDYTLKGPKYRALCLLIALMIGARMAGGQGSGKDSVVRDPHAVQPERPTVATHAGTVARGWIELEEGGEWDKSADGTRSFSAPTNLKIGLGSRTQLNLMFNLISAASVRGGNISFGDLTIGVKYRIVDGDRLLGDFAMLPAVKLPTGQESAGAGSGTTDFSLLLISSRQLGPVSMDLNVGATRRSGDGSRAPIASTVWTASFGFPVLGDLGWVAELFGYPPTTGIAGTAAFLTGPTFTAREWLAFDAGVISPITGPQANAAYAGLVWNLGCLLPRGRCR
jgi:Putative MetA-pathway of phenol degradation